jgi:O-antigen ligase
MNSSSLYTTEPQLVSNPARALARSFPMRVLAWLFLHVIFAFMVRSFPVLATVHALAILFLGLYWIWQSEKHTNRIIYLTAYITGAELLWRSMEAAVFWEFAKYSVILLLGLSLLRQKKLLQSPRLPIFYFVLLLPALFLLPVFDRQQIAFNLSGPLALVVATIYFRQCRLTKQELTTLLLAMLGPVVGIAALASWATFTTVGLTFTASVAPRITAAGFGPNQSSSIFGLGMFLALWLVVLKGKQPFLRWVMVLLMLWLAGQTLLTFSRGGFWTAVGAIGVAAFYLLRDRQSRRYLVAAAATTVLLGYFLLFPYLDNFTGGALSARLEDSDLTGRDRIVEVDLLIFQQNPIFGVGPGQSKTLHALTFKEANAHTEYSRLLAEHGMFGLLSLLLLLGMVARQWFFTEATPTGRALTASSFVWALLYMTHAAMRLLAPAYLFGLAAVHILFDSETAPEPPNSIYVARD